MKTLVCQTRPLCARRRRPIRDILRGLSPPPSCAHFADVFKESLEWPNPTQNWRLAARPRPEPDAHGRWIDECLDLSDPNATLLLADLFASWTAWAEREKKFTGTTNAFSRELVRRWGEARKGHGEKGVFFKGVKLG